MKETEADERLQSLLADESYSDRQLGAVLRLAMSAGQDGYCNGDSAGYRDGVEAGHEEGLEEGFIEGYETGFSHAYIKQVYVGVWAGDEAASLDLGTTLRLIGVSTTRQGALAKAQAYKDQHGSGRVFSYSFNLQHDNDESNVLDLERPSSTCSDCEDCACQSISESKGLLNH